MNVLWSKLEQCLIHASCVQLTTEVLVANSRVLNILGDPNVASWQVITEYSSEQLRLGTKDMALKYCSKQ